MEEKELILFFYENGKKIAVERHKIAKGISDENYVENRTRELLEFFDRAYIIERESDIPRTGLIKTHLDYFRIKRIADKKIEKIIKNNKELAEVPF